MNIEGHNVTESEREARIFFYVLVLSYIQFLRDKEREKMPEYIAIIPVLYIKFYV